MLRHKNKVRMFSDMEDRRGWRGMLDQVRMIQIGDAMRMPFVKVKRCKDT